MRVTVKFAVRFLVAVAVLGALSSVFAPTGSSRSPYLSALSEITGGSALVAASCSNSVCAHLKNRCNPVDPSRLQNCSKAGGTCVDSMCI